MQKPAMRPARRGRVEAVLRPRATAASSLVPPTTPPRQVTADRRGINRNGRLPVGAGRLRSNTTSLERDLGALRLELRLRLVGGLLVGVLQNSLRRRLDEVLRLFEAQAGQL